MKEICVIGDVMLDKYSYGTVNRLNPEGPNPLINIERESIKLGGAANVASNISSLEGSSNLIGVIGADINGDLFEILCKKNNINFDGIKNGSPTITKQRFIETTYQQQLLRADFEEIYSLTKEYNKKIIDILELKNPEYIIVSDYKKGIVNSELMSHIIKRKNTKVLVDSKPENINHFEGSYLIKPNFKEFQKMIGKEIPNEDEIIKQEGKIFGKKMRANIVITRGSKGAMLITQEGECFSIPTEAQQVFDVTGAGDTFLATLTVAIRKGYSLKEAIYRGNKASGIVVGKVGTAKVTKEELGFI